MLAQARKAVVDYKTSGRTSPLRLPPQLTQQDRAALHEVAARLGLEHKRARETPNTSDAWSFRDEKVCKALSAGCGR